MLVLKHSFYRNRNTKWRIHKKKIKRLRSKNDIIVSSIIDSKNNKPIQIVTIAFDVILNNVFRQQTTTM